MNINAGIMVLLFKKNSTDQILLMEPTILDT